MRRNAGLIIVLACLGLGCLRWVAAGSPEPAPTGKPGDTCASSSECISAKCVEGVCCNRACAAEESCVLPDTRGSCTTRQVGAPCREHAQCPTAHCVDGVCCDAACTNGCEQCNAPASPGHCVPAVDNTDPRNHCHGPCFACFGRVCAPALVGSNPKVSADGGTGCSEVEACDPTGACKAALGQPCVSSSATSFSDTCASQTCLADACLQPISERVPPSVGNPRAQRRELMDAVVLDDDTACVLFRETQRDEFPTPPNSVGGAYAFDVRRHGLTLACRRQGSWAGRSLVDFAPSAVDLTGDKDRGGNALRERFFHLLQLRSTPSGPVLLAHLTSLLPQGSPALLEALGTQDCAVVANWFSAGLGEGGRRCLLAQEHLQTTTSDPFYWYSAQVVDGTHFSLALAMDTGHGVELRLHDCPDAACRPGKAVAVDDVGSWPGILVLEGTRPIIFHYPEAFDRIRALDGDAAVEFPLAGCSLGQSPLEGSGPYDGDHPSRSLEAARVTAGGQPRWMLTFPCSGDIGTVFYDPGTRTFGPLKLVPGGGDALHAASPLALAGNRTALLTASRLSLAFWWSRADGASHLQAMRAVDSAREVRGAWAQAPTGLPHIAWEEMEHGVTQIPGVGVTEWPRWTDIALYYRRARP